MAQNRIGALSRDEIDLLRYYRELSPQEKMNLLGAAESRFNGVERMKELACREIETCWSGEDTLRY